MPNSENRLAIAHQSLENNPDRGNILWQVQEVNFPGIKNWFYAVDELILKINDLITNPHSSPEDMWLFRKKNDIPTSVQFMLFQNPQRVYGLVYDSAFFIRAMSIGDRIIAFPMGHTTEAIYNQYYAAKFGDRSKIPQFPKTSIEGFLKCPDDGLFELDAIYKNDWDCKPEYLRTHHSRELLALNK